MKSLSNPWAALGTPLAALAARGAATVGPWLGASIWGGRRRHGEPPLVRGNLPWLGNALPFSRNAALFLQACRRKHGDVFTVYVARNRMTFVCDPLSYSSVLRSPELQFEPIADEVMDRAFSFPDIRTEIDLERLDGAARKYLKGPHLGEISAGMCASVFAVLADTRHGPLHGAAGSLSLYRFVWDVVFAAGTETIFGEGKSCPAIARAFQDLDRDFPTLVAGMPRFMARDGIAGLAALAQPFAELGTRPSRWLTERQKVIVDLDPKRRGHAHSAALWAVHANTIPAVFWTLAHVLSDEVATRAIWREIQREVGAPADAAISVESLARLPLLHSAAQEALRIATGSMTIRRATQALQLQTRAGTFAVRAGDRVCLAPQLTHHDPHVFEDPQTYRYDRFVDRGAGLPQFHKGGERAGFAFMPFGAGKHMCPGRFFAINEIKIVVATLMRRVALQPIRAALPAYDHGRVGLGVFPPKGDIIVKWQRRD